MIDKLLKNDSEPNSYSKRIKRTSWLFGIITGVLAVITFFVMLSRPSENGDMNPVKLVRALMLFPVGGLVLGMSLAILFAPTSFLKSIEGKRWMKMVGTRRVNETRIVAGIFALLGLAFFIFLVLALITDEFQKPLFG